MAFIGLTDAYNASVCLLYHMYEGEMKEWMFATHARKAEDTLAKEGAVMADRLGGLRVDRDYWFGNGVFCETSPLNRTVTFPHRHKLQPEDDPNDWEVYLMAKRLFLARLQVSGGCPYFVWGF